MKRALLLSLTLLLAPRAWALPCHTPELLFALPPEGATGVPTDATLVAGYATSAVYAGEDVVLTEAGGDPRPLTGTFDRAQGLLSVKPPDGLTPGASYSIAWPSLRGVDTATPGLGREVHFTAGAAPDAEAPRFDGVTGVTWDLDRARNDCSGDVEERLTFDLTLAPASDDGGRGSLSLVVLQTAGPDITSPVQVSNGALPAGGARITLPVSRAVGHVCFAALAVDLTGKLSQSGRIEACAETTAPPFFRGCAVGGRGGDGAWLALGLALLLRRRRRR